jgi:hypothetical protein
MTGARGEIILQIFFSMGVKQSELTNLKRENERVAVIAMSYDRVSENEQHKKGRNEIRQMVRRLRQRNQSSLNT